MLSECYKLVQTCLLFAGIPLLIVMLLIYYCLSVIKKNMNITIEYMVNCKRLERTCTTSEERGGEAIASVVFFLIYK